jgi:hypothetical protein
MKKYKIEEEKLIEAADWIAGRMDELYENDCCVPPTYRGQKEMDALGIAHQCIAKQFPVAVNVKKNGRGIETYWCPNCKKQQGSTPLGYFEATAFCERCGQLLYVYRGENIVTEN